jgi:hypothetical protein
MPTLLGALLSFVNNFQTSFSFNHIVLIIVCIALVSSVINLDLKQETLFNYMVVDFSSFGILSNDICSYKMFKR